MTEPAAPHETLSAAPLPVGNPAAGLEQQPDYEAMANRLRTEIAPELPTRLPSGEQACADLMNAVVRHYANDDPSVVAGLELTREADRARCVRETSPAAALCVAMVLPREGGEWPWWLDQCERAFPR